MRALVPPRTDQRGFEDGGAQDVPPALRKLLDAFWERNAEPLLFESVRNLAIVFCTLCIDC
jgi:hypothetical protein